MTTLAKCCRWSYYKLSRRTLCGSKSQNTNEGTLDAKFQFLNRLMSNFPYTSLYVASLCSCLITTWFRVDGTMSIPINRRVETLKMISGITGSFFILKVICFSFLNSEINAHGNFIVAAKHIFSNNVSNKYIISQGPGEDYFEHSISSSTVDSLTNIQLEVSIFHLTRSKWH